MAASRSRGELLATLGIPLAALAVAVFLFYELSGPDGAVDSGDWIPYPFFALVSAVTVRQVSRNFSRPRGYLVGGFIYFAYTLLLLAVWLVVITLNGGWG
jgi:hypothetical protein